MIHSIPYLSRNIPAYEPHGLSPIGPSTSPPAERPVNTRQKSQTFDEVAYLASSEHGRLEIMEDDSFVFDKRKRS